MQPAETDDELAKGEALVEALTTFCNVVRKTPRSAPEDQELLSAAGKLGMEHIIPIYRVTPPLSLTWRAAVLRCIAMPCARLHTMLSTQGALHPSINGTLCSSILLAGLCQSTWYLSAHWLSMNGKFNLLWPDPCSGPQGL